MSPLVEAIMNRMAHMVQTDINVPYFKERNLKFDNHYRPVYLMDDPTRAALGSAFRFVSFPYDRANGITNK